MEHKEEPIAGLPENAFRELKEGEQYEPLMPAQKAVPEVTLWSVLWGILMAVLFSAASAYLGLKVGQVFEAAIPIAIVGTNPVSGMTLMTLILSSVVMVAVGLTGTSGMTAALIIGGVVCTALSMAGGFITDLKIGYWLGSTPAKQQGWKFLGTLVSAATVGGVILVLNKTYGFTSGALAAPQANAMAAVIKPLLIGGLVNWYVGSRSKEASVNAQRVEKGTLIASGFIAGGALMGVASATMRFGGFNFVNEEWLANPASEWVALGAYLLLIVYLAMAGMRITSEKKS